MLVLCFKHIHLKNESQKCPMESQYSRNGFLLSCLNPGAPEMKLWTGHILAFSNCYMLLFLRLQASLPEKSLALFLEPN